MLEQVIGSTAISLGLLLATFMGGMCFGSFLLPRLVPPQLNPLRVYLALELGIGACGALMLVLVPIGRVAAVGLLVPTMLMGATLPALSRAIDAAWLGLMYGANIAGGVLGSLLAGFYLLRIYDVTITTYVAVGINVLVVIAGQTIVLCDLPMPTNTAGKRQAAVVSHTSIYFSIALSGFCALAAEAIWTRNLGLLFGASVYTLSIILAVFLAGLGVGSVLGSVFSRVGAHTRRALGACQLLLATAIAWAAYAISASFPYWPVNPAISSDIRFNFELDLVRAFWALFPAALLWGASFPLALASATPKGTDPGRLMAAIYASNTLGAIAGALVTTLLVIPRIGSQHAQQLLVVISAVSALLVLPRAWVAFPIAAALFALSIPQVPPILIAYGRYAATWTGKADVIYAREGMNSSVAVSSFPNGVRTFHVSGKIQASNVPRDMRLQRMLGHLTTLTADHPRSILVIGCGAGITAGAVSIDPRVERVSIAEIEPLVMEAAAQYFGEPNFEVLHNPKTRVHIDDGRHFVLTSKERFDGITVDPLDPWVKGAANLYTKEFLESMKRHLNRGGTVTMYIQLFETTNEAVKSAVATFFDVFPNGTIWGNTYEGRGHDMILLGQVEPIRIDLDDMETRFGYRNPGSRIPQSLAEVGMSSPVDLFATYAGRKSELTEWLKGAAINGDLNLRMQYLAGLGLNLDESASIYASMLVNRGFPEDIFASSEGRVGSLRRMLQRGQ